MASKITDLAAQTAPVAADLLETVDVSDTSMAGTGTNKKMTMTTLGTLISSEGFVVTAPHPTISRTDLHASAISLHLPLSCNTGSVGTAGSGLAQRPFWWPFMIDRPLSVITIRTYCWTLESGSTLRVGLYECDSDFVPGALIADYGTMSGASTGAKSASGSTVIPTGLFSLCVWPSNHTTVRWSKPGTLTPAGVFGEATVASGGSYAHAWRLTAETADYSAGLPDPAPTALYPVITSAASAVTVAYVEYGAP